MLSSAVWSVSVRDVGLILLAPQLCVGGGCLHCCRQLTSARCRCAGANVRAHEQPYGTLVRYMRVLMIILAFHLTYAVIADVLYDE